MIKKILKFFFFASFFSFNSVLDSFAQKTIKLSDSTEIIEINPENLEMFEDKSNILDFEDIKNKKFSRNKSYKKAHGFSNSRFWFRFKALNNTNKDWILNFKASQLDEIYLFFVNNGKILKVKKSGDMFPFSQREFDTPHFAFKIDTPKDSTQTFYLSIFSKDTKQFELFLSTVPNFDQRMKNIYIFGSFYFGMFFMMFLYTIILFFTILDRTYLYYFLFIGCFACFQLTIIGFSCQYLWGDNVYFNNASTNFFNGTSTLFFALFSFKFLNIRIIYPKLKWIYFYLIFYGLTVTLLSLVVRSVLFNYLVAIFSFIHIGLEVFGGLMILNKGYNPAKYYLISWSILFLGILIFILKILKIVPNNDFTLYVLPFGSLFEIVLLSLGLGIRLNESKKEKEQTQEKLLTQLIKNEQDKEKIARDLHDDLGSTLSSIRILSEVAENLSKNVSGDVPQLLKKIVNNTQKLQDNLQDIVWASQSKNDSAEELVIRIRQFAGLLLETKNIHYELQISKEINLLKIDANIQYDIFMIFKEILNNMVKHADATFITINFSQEKTALVLEMKDNGKGFDLKIQKNGNGLRNIKERSLKMNADLSIFSEFNIGTTIILKMIVPQ